MQPTDAYFPSIAELIGVALVGVAWLSFYVITKRGELKRTTRRLAAALKVELLLITDITKSTTRIGVQFRSGWPAALLSSSVYDGMVNSAAISNFDEEVQLMLHNYYIHVKNGSMDALRKDTHNVSKKMDDIIKKNRARFRYL